MIRILFVDDDPQRREQFLAESRLTEHDIHFGHDAHEAMVKLSLFGRFDVAFLDHDLGDFGPDGQPATRSRGYGEPGELTGYDVAKAIAMMPPARRPGRVIVHSWNPCGARRMADALIEAGVPTRVIPFRVGLIEEVRS